MKKIEELKVGQKYSFKVGSHNYSFVKLNDKSGQQENTSTNKKRDCRKIKVKHVESGDKYPEFWNDSGAYYHDFDSKQLYYSSGNNNKSNAVEQDYIKPNLVQLDLTSNMAKHIEKNFYATAPKNKHEIIKIESVQNRYLWDKYYGAKKALKKSIGRDKLNEMNLWHGTDTDTITKITKLGFRKEFNFTCYYGEGTYFAKNAGYSVNYCKKPKNNIYQILYCKALCGEWSLGSKDKTLTNWPIKQDGTGQIFDSLVNNTSNPIIWVIHDDARVYPMFIVYFKIKK